MILNDVHTGIQKRKPRKRIGRGPGSGHGKTSGRGHKGYYSRSGSRRRHGFEGGQMPLQRRVPKRGFHNMFRKRYAIVNVKQIAGLGESAVSPELLLERGLIRKLYDGLKVLGEGELKTAVTVSAHRFSQSAREKIVRAGGNAEVIGSG